MSPTPGNRAEPRGLIRPLLPGALLLAAALVAAPAPAAEEAGAEESSEATQTERIEVGQPAPDFALEDLEGDSHRLSEHLSEDGGPVVLVFFRGAW